MATAEQIDTLRRKIDDMAAPQAYTDDYLSGLIDAQADDTDAVAASIWQEKAASYSKLVNVSESGSSRSMGDLYKNALAMAKYYGDRDTVTTTEVSQRSRTRAISRI